MAEKMFCLRQQQTKPIKVLKWKVNESNTVSIGRILLLYQFEGVDKTEQRKLKSTQAGTIRRIIAKEGAIVRPGEVICELKACCHPTIMNDMCAECGADLRKDDLTAIASVPMVHSIPDLKVSEETAQKLGKADGDRLIKDRKLVLLVDLDQTLIHTTNDNIPSNLRNVYHFQLYGPASPWYHTRLRPGTHQFLNNIFPLFELHICTFGARNYAHMIAMFLDKEQKFFSNRILSRDECFDPTSKKANLKALFPCGDNMVCIIDDREDVWSQAANLIHVKPYHFFQHTGDINAPPGLDKHEEDNKCGVDLTQIEEKCKINEIDKNKSVNGDNKDDLKEETNCNSNEKDRNGDNSEETQKEQEEVDKKKSEEIKDKSKEEQEIDGKETEEIKDKSKGEQEIDGKETEEIKDKSKEEDKADVKESGEIKSDGKEPEENKDNSEGEPETDKKNSIENNDKSKADTTNAIENKEDNLIDVDDPDDYLLHLEGILKRVHTAFYEAYDKMESGEVPDLKTVIPNVRSRVLQGSKLVFSGLVPTHIKLEQSKAYQIAKNLGANVTQDLENDTTHLVATRPGTIKVNAGRRRKNLKIVTPDWLWSCAERWEHVDERVFPLNSKCSKTRHPPPHCSSPEHVTSYPEHNTPAVRKRTPSGRFMDTINPLMSFSSDEIANMDKEVEDILDDDTDDSSDEDETNQKQSQYQLEGKENGNSSNSSNSSTSSEDSLTAEYPKGHKRRRVEENKVIDMNNSTTEDDEIPSARFRRGEIVDNELDLEQDSQESDGSVEAPDEVDDGEWNMMGAALEREFLSNN